MNFALIGHTGHMDFYEQTVKDLPDLKVVAVATSMAGESLDSFDEAPGIRSETRRYNEYEEMLDKESPDLVQICVQPNLLPGFIELCLKRGLPVISEKSLAMDLQTLARLYEVAKEVNLPLAPLHGYRRMKCFEAVRDAVQAGRIGEPQASFSQISLKWGKRRGDSYKSRETFPGIVPFIGTHVIDWLLWCMGDVFVEVSGWESTTAHPDYPAFASQAGFLLRMDNGGVAAVTLDFLRPLSAPTHGDERVRISGTEGVVESLAIQGSARLLNEAEGAVDLDIPTTEHWYTNFVKSVQGKGEPFIGVDEAFRVTEIAIKTQQAIDEGKTLSLTESPYS